MKSLELSGQVDGVAERNGRDRDTRARRVALLSFERRRAKLEADLQRPLRRPRLPRKRYEDLRLAAALGRVETRCLERPGQAAAAVDECLFARLSQEVATVQESLGRMEKWLSSEARRRAETDAEERFLTIADEVRAELAAQGLVAPARRPQEPRTAESKETEPKHTVETHRCTATTRKGGRCKNRARTPGLCAVHARLATAVAAATPDDEAQASDDPQPSAGSDLVPIPVERLRALSENLTEEPVAVPDLAAVRARLRAIPLPHLPKLQPPHLPKLELASLRARVPAWHRPSLPSRITVPHVPARIGAGPTWAVGGSAALAVAGVLIWSGLSGSGSGPSAGELEIASAEALPTLPVSQASPADDTGTEGDAATLVARDTSREAAGHRGRTAAAGASGGRGPSFREPATAPGDPGTGPSGSGSSEPPAPAPAPAPAPSPAPAPDPGGEPGGGAPTGPAPAPPSPAPSPSPAPDLVDTAQGVISDVTKPVGEAVERLPLLGTP